MTTIAEWNFFKEEILVAFCLFQFCTCRIEVMMMTENKFDKKKRMGSGTDKRNLCRLYKHHC